MQRRGALEAVRLERRFLITADKGFADIRHRPPGQHPGVLLVRPTEDGVRPILDLLEMVLRKCGIDGLEGTVSVATPAGIRIRRDTGGFGPVSRKSSSD